MRHLLKTTENWPKRSQIKVEKTKPSQCKGISKGGIPIYLDREKSRVPLPAKRSYGKTVNE